MVDSGELVTRLEKVIDELDQLSSEAMPISVTAGMFIQSAAGLTKRGLGVLKQILSYKQGPR